MAVSMITTYFVSLCLTAAAFWKAKKYLDAGVHQSLWQADGITGLLDVCPFLSVSLCDMLRPLIGQASVP